MKSLLARLPAMRGPLLVGVALTLFALAVLLPGFQLAGRLDDTTAALRLVSEQRRQADVIAAALGALRDRLENYGYVDEPLNEVRNSIAELDALVRTLKADPSAAGRFTVSASRPILYERALTADLAAFESTWDHFRQGLVPVAAFQGVPYTDSESAGVKLNEGGRMLSNESRKAIVSVRKDGVRMTAALGQLAGALEAESARLSAYLRFLMLIALAGTLACGAVLGYFAVARRRQAVLLADAKRQTEGILQTVKEGLFLLDPKGTIGGAHSASMRKLFKRDPIAGLTLEELLRPIVPAKSLQTALRFVEILWSERTKENLVKSINPLQEVEVVFETGSGGQETRWLEFDFHRVRDAGKVSHLLVSVTDVSARVRLGRELADLRERAQSQVDTLLGVLQVNPEQLRSFLGDTDTSMRMINAMLKDPTHDDAGLRRKVEAIFRQMHAIKGEASALGLATVQGRAHEFEESLKTLREQDAIGGGDFLPLAVRLDDLFSHLESLTDLVERLAQQGLDTTTADESGNGAVARAAPRVTDQARAANSLIDTLDQLVERVSQDRGKAARLVTHGLDTVPESYRRAVKDIAVQALRNSLVHGIEPSDMRQIGGKPVTGTLTVHFKDEGTNGYRLVVEDDGAGLSLRRIREAAVERGILTREDAARLDSKQLLPLLFRAGFSTQSETDVDAGRGVGMSVVAEIVKEHNGRLGISSGEGRYTRLSVVLPALDAMQSAVA
jgi:HPt (histidine-containing phosphotransfer) domain-containing protein/PAS domain-containing protein